MLVRTSKYESTTVVVEIYRGHKLKTEILFCFAHKKDKENEFQKVNSEYFGLLAPKNINFISPFPSMIIYKEASLNKIQRKASKQICEVSVCSQIFLTF